MAFAPPIGENVHDFRSILRNASRPQDEQSQHSHSAAIPHEDDCTESKQATISEISEYINEQKGAMTGAIVRMQRSHELVLRAAGNLEQVISNMSNGCELPGKLKGIALNSAFGSGGSGGSDSPRIRKTRRPSKEKKCVEHVTPPVDDHLAVTIPLGTPYEIQKVSPQFEEGPSNELREDRNMDATDTSKRNFGRFAKLRPSSQGTASMLDLSLRSTVNNILKNSAVQAVSVSLILFTVYLIGVDTNARARGDEASTWVDFAMLFCFVAYLLEFFATLYVERRQALHNHWTYVDAFVITTSSFEYLVQLVGIKGLSLLRLARICRLLRLGRVVRSLKRLRSMKYVKEQYIMMSMMASCVRTLIWAFLFCCFIMSLWSILAVELLHDIVVRLDKSTSVWKDCQRCGRAFASIWESNLTFMQTIVAGDSWGLVALPVIEDSWWSGFIFVGALSTVVYGVLNMITVVVIDTFAERRAKDLTHAATELEYEEIEERKQLEKMFTKIDEDGSGALTLEELKEGATKVREFHQYLRVLDIDDKDLVDLFHMIDADGSGEVDPEEFIDALYRMKSTESKTATRFLKHMVANLFDRTQSLDARLDRIQTNITSKLVDVEKQLRQEIQEIEEKSQEGSMQDVLEDHIIEINAIMASGIEKAVSVAFLEARASSVVQANESKMSLLSKTTNSNSALTPGAIIRLG